MKSVMPMRIQPQPDETTCGPTCLHTIYDYYGDTVSLERVVEEVPRLQGGGTLGAHLGAHALGRGYRAAIYTYNLTLFDPTWFGHEAFYIKNKLMQQASLKSDPKLGEATAAYGEFLDRGGELRFEVLRPGLIRHLLEEGKPLMAGLSATFLYRSMREYGSGLDYDDLRGEPAGHFVVLHGYDSKRRTLVVADPLHGNPVGGEQIYEMDIDRVLNAILLGIVTYDANLILIAPPEMETTD